MTELIKSEETMMHSTILKHFNEEYQTGHVKVEMYEDELWLTYGDVITGISQRSFWSVTEEVYLFSDHPELMDISDGIAWDIELLHAFITAKPDDIAGLLTETATTAIIEDQERSESDTQEMEAVEDDTPDFDDEIWNIWRNEGTDQDALSASGD